VKVNLSASEVNHLRRLIAYINCEIGQSPDEMVATVKSVAHAIGPELSEEGKGRLMNAYTKSASVPKYVRHAVKALRKTIAGSEPQIVNAGMVREVREIKEVKA
jgi:hypothetical protein